MHRIWVMQIKHLQRLQIHHQIQLKTTKKNWRTTRLWIIVRRLLWILLHRMQLKKKISSMKGMFFILRSIFFGFFASISYTASTWTDLVDRLVSAICSQNTNFRHLRERYMMKNKNNVNFSRWTHPAKQIVFLLHTCMKYEWEFQNHARTHMHIVQIDISMFT